MFKNKNYIIQKIVNTNNSGDDMYIIPILLVFFVLVIIVPIRVNINYETGENLKVKNYILIKILYFIPIYKFNVYKKEETKNKNSNSSSQKIDRIYNVLMELIGYSKYKKKIINKKDINKVLNSMYFEKLDLQIGINLNEYIVNSYIMSGLNMLLCMYINKNIKNFNFNNIFYSAYISKDMYELKVNSIVRIKLVNNIYILIKVLINLLKLKFMKGKVKKNVATSHRESYGYNNDITRKYD